MSHGHKHQLLAEHIDGIVEKLRALIPDALETGEIDAIHQARVATRRLKAALELVESITSDEHRKPMGLTLRKLRRRLGPLRDLDVMTGHLSEMKRFHSHAIAIDWLSTRFKSQRDAAFEKNKSKASSSKVLSKLGTWWGVRQDLDAAGDSIESLLARSLHDQLETFSSNADFLAAESETESPEDTAVPDVAPIDPHAIRIAGKSLRYTIEMASAQGHDIPKSVAKAFKKMQDALGLWHDYVVLTERMLLQCADEMLAHHDAAMQRRILALSQLTLRRSETQLEKFAKLWKENGRDVSQAIRAAFADSAGTSESRAATESKMGRDRTPNDESSTPATASQDDPQPA